MRGTIHIGNALNLAIVLHFARKILRKVSSEGNRNAMPVEPRQYMFYCNSLREITVLGDASDRLKKLVDEAGDMAYRCTFYTVAEVHDMLCRKICGISHPCYDDSLNEISIAYDGGRSAGDFMDELCMYQTSRQ